MWAVTDPGRQCNSVVIPIAIWRVKSLDQFKLSLLLLEFMTSGENCDQTGVLKYCLIVGPPYTDKG